MVYKDSILYFDDSKKWKERFAIVRADYSLELHDSQEVPQHNPIMQEIIRKISHYGL